jgi:hypothetical protein
MSSLQEIEKDIISTKKIIDNPNSSAAVKNVAEKKLKSLEEERLLNQQSQLTPAPQQVVSTGGSDVVSAILATLKQYMESNAGGGLDSESVRAMINEYLKTQKISLEDLDKSVLDEIKKNQTIITGPKAFPIAAVPNC